MATKENLKGATINLGNPDEYTVLETAKQIFALIHGSADEAKITFSPLPKDDPVRRKPDISRAKEVLGWEPQVSFADGLAHTIEFFKQNP